MESKVSKTSQTNNGINDNSMDYEGKRFIVNIKIKTIFFRCVRSF
jgi:hypothetical protein